MSSIRSVLVLVALVGLATPLAGQGVVVDQGSFEIRVNGEAVGTEVFAIRRAGYGRDDAIFANGTLSLLVEGRAQEVRPLLRATPPSGVVAGYQVEVSGPGALTLQMSRVGRRYVAIIRSEVGEEDREFSARADTRILDAGVAHHYYFTRDVREGSTFHSLEPRSRSQSNLTAGPWTDVELTLGVNAVPARRVDFAGDGGEDRRVWFDRLGRVLRVEIPSRGYVAERTDLVG